MCMLGQWVPSASPDDTKLGAVSDVLEHLAAIQKDMDMMKKFSRKPGAEILQQKPCAAQQN